MTTINHDGDILFCQTFGKFIKQMSFKHPNNGIKSDVSRDFNSDVLIIDENNHLICALKYRDSFVYMLMLFAYEHCVICGKTST